MSSPASTSAGRTWWSRLSITAQVGVGRNVLGIEQVAVEPEPACPPGSEPDQVGRDPGAGRPSRHSRAAVSTSARTSAAIILCRRPARRHRRPAPRLSGSSARVGRRGRSSRRPSAPSSRARHRRRRDSRRPSAAAGVGPAVGEPVPRLGTGARVPAVGALPERGVDERATSTGSQIRIRSRTPAPSSADSTSTWTWQPQVSCSAVVRPRWSIIAWYRGLTVVFGATTDGRRRWRRSARPAARPGRSPDVSTGRAGAEVGQGGGRGCTDLDLLLLELRLDHPLCRRRRSASSSRDHLSLSASESRSAPDPER